MRAAAYLSVEADPRLRDRTRISRLRSDGPLVLRPTSPTNPEPMARWNLAGPGPARVSLAAGAAGPLGGDQFCLDIEVGPGAALVLRTVAATLLLPGPHGRPSFSEMTVRVAAGGTLVWLPGPMIAARGCDHHTTTRVQLDSGARLLIREELVLGRHGERPGAVRQRLRVRLADRPLHDQELHIGPVAVGWDGAAVTGRRKAVGSLLLVDPDPQLTTAASACLNERDATSDAALLPLGGPAILVTALADDALTLRRRLDAALTTLDRAHPSVAAGTAC